MLEQTFPQKLDRAILEKNSLVCCGLDPDIRKMPIYFQELEDVEKSIEQFLYKIIDLTHAHVCSYKIQKAFFDLYPSGKNILKSIVQYILKVSPVTPVIIDCKIGDIGNTMRAYFSSIFDDINADAVVLNPYMGHDVWNLLNGYSNRAGLILVRTSNPGSKVFQEAQLRDGSPFWSFVLQTVISEWENGFTLIPIISSNSISEFTELRKQIIPDEMPLFLAGVGAQGGHVQGVKGLINSSGRGLMINSARGILYPYNILENKWESTIEQSVISLKESINNFRK